MSVTISTAGTVALGSLATIGFVLFVLLLINRLRVWSGHGCSRYIDDRIENIKEYEEKK